MAETAFRSIKVLVQDLAAAAKFYTAVTGLQEAFRHKTKSGALEIAFTGQLGDPGLMLMEYATPPATPQSNVVLVFNTDDAVAFGKRAVEAGGGIVHDVQQVTAAGKVFTIVLAHDPEGNTLEAVQQS
jgi:predicted enzyme related to lactoylglutathione lyase